MSTQSSIFDRFKRWLRSSIMLRIVGIAILILLLMIPTSEIRSLVYERENLRDQAIGNISESWGSDQILTGPILTVPYEEAYKDSDDNIRTRIDYAHFLPEALDVSGSLSPELRSRSIYEAVLYVAHSTWTGSFSFPDPELLNIPEEDMHWDDAFVSFGISDVRGIDKQLSLNWKGQNLPFSPGLISADLLSSGISSDTPLDPEQRGTIPFSISLDLKGSNSIYFSPLGKTTTVNLSAPWADPKFAGAFLPKTREVNEAFIASWEVLHLNRNFPQQWTGGNHNGFSRDFNFGVELLIQVDHYRKSERSIKYALMLISLTFLIFFFVEIMNRQRIHPISYLLVGLAITIFYALLVSLSEHIPFGWAFLIGAVAVILLITAYARSVLKSNRLTGIMTGMLILMFGFNFSLLQLQDYALLIGVLGLFAVLTAVMLVARKIDWYAYSKEEGEG